MLETLRVKNLTVFGLEDFEFSPGLNVIVGENGTGKTHILKVAYSVLYVSSRGAKESGSDNPKKAHLEGAIAKKLTGVFKPDRLGRLVSRRSRGRCEIECRFVPAKHQLAFSFHTASESDVKIERPPSAWIDKLPVYLPTRELLTIYPGFVSLYETSHLSFEETWRDTCILLGAPLVRGPREQRIKQLLVPLEGALQGKVELSDAGGFYLNVDGVPLEMHLVAEGLRKLATIARLIATGSLIDKGYLFWDEPESNLNPRIIKLVARTILHLCQNGIQVFVASHSLFLLRELDILLKTEEFQGTPSRFFGLLKAEGGVSVQQGDTVDDIGDISSLQEELSQSDRYLKSEAE